MKLADLKRLVAQGEGQELEFKRSTGDRRHAMESLCGMLNATGRGEVIFGVTDKGKIVGQDVGEPTLRQIASESGKIEPAPDVTTSTVALAGGKAVIVATAVVRDPGPFTFSGRPFKRVGPQTQQMRREEFDRRLADRLDRETPWDHRPAPGWSADDLDAEEIHRTVEAAVEGQRLTGALDEEPAVILRRLELVTDAGITRAAAVLFGKGNAAHFPVGSLRLARFRGVTKDEFSDNRQFDGSAFTLLRHAESFLADHVPVASTFVPGQMERKDSPLYPPLALREALVNALVHRDYSVDGGAVSIAMFDDRLEIWSTGRLPEGLTPEKLKGEHESILRNRKIAGVFHRRGLVERWGRGTNKIIEEASKAGCPEPGFEEVAGSFVVRFRAAEAAVPETPQVTPRITPQIAPQITPQVVAVLEAAGEPATRGELQKAAGLRDRKNFRVKYLEPLVACGWLAMTMPEKPRSRNQRFTTTAAGAKAMGESGQG
jgi:ATP-dependent DNA helicase RecG